MDAHDRFVLGQTFTTRYVMSGKHIVCLSTITALEEGRLLEIRHSNCVGEKIHKDLTVAERITLVESGGRTVLVKDIDIKNSGTPWFLLALIWFLTRIGSPVGPNKLKMLCDTNAKNYP